MMKSYYPIIENSIDTTETAAYEQSMNIRILGNGGAISDGLPYNAFLTDGYFLTETPPDIMGSLYRENAALSGIRTIFISHFHADHYFGFPFLALRLFFNGITEPIAIIGPPGGQ